MISAIRGAITVDSNCHKHIKSSTIELINAIYQDNNIVSEDIISMIFSVTKDITVANPARYFRENFVSDIPLFCVQEADMEQGIPLCIRVIIHCEKNKKDIKHCYLKKAKDLRRDLK